MVCFKVLLRHLTGVTERNHKNPVRIVYATADVQTGHLPNTSQNHYHLSQLACLARY
jgi:hypothetical protein